MIEIHNAGQAITRTSYWRTAHARQGLLYLSINAGALRLLVPEPTIRVLRELPPVGTPCTISRAEIHGQPTYALEWHDEQPDPYLVEISQAQSDRSWPTAEDGRVLPLIWYAPVGVLGVREARRERIQIGEVVAS